MEIINHSVEMTYYHNYHDIKCIILHDLGTPKATLKKQEIDAWLIIFLCNLVGDLPGKIDDT